MKLVKFDSNWADEFDVQGWAVMTDERYERWHAAWLNGEYPEVMGIGTNQEIEFKNAEEFFECIKVTDISDDEGATIINRFGKTHGFFP